MKQAKQLAMLFLALVVLFASSQPAGATRAGAKSGEPGEGCSDGFTRYQYLTPPYMGTLTVGWNDGRIYLSGILAQVGNSACVAEIPLFDSGEMTLGEFQSLQADDLRGACHTDLVSYFTCVQYEANAVEIVGAHSLRYDAETNSFTVKVLVMPLVQKF